MEAIVREVEPKTLFTHFAHDLNVDHRMEHEAVMTAVRPQPGSGGASVLTVETLSRAEGRAPERTLAFGPNWFVDIVDTLEVKLRALGARAEEMRPSPHVRSRVAVEHLSRWRDMTIGPPAAEALIVASHKA